ncbi:MAG TPA: transporter substrate-binding domain-containing protein [Candidatus Gallacutalibacter pullicola]|uniref:Transporter substrate-binding domain-containing protein n=1 Tax=Candidatus Gallacutalibacter pullicola TaxID=2840830 RepID=A0A9D1DPE8_9FIRM|nr:transporter substrate-binding domain-containing protein [Candidatus Gallacutalibacter pullicola]
MKKVLSLIMAAALCIAMPACSSTQESSSAAESSETSSSSTESSEASASEASEASGNAEGSAEESDLAYIQDKGTLVVGVTEFEPMDYLDENGEWTGFDADMAREVGAILGVDVEFSSIDWNNKIFELDNKSIDCLWNGMTITEEITTAASATNPYANNGQVVVVKSDVADQYQTEESLADLTFAVEAGSAGQAAAEEAGLNFITVNAQADAVMEVAAGTSDACVIDMLMAIAMLGEGTDYADLTYTVTLTDEEYGIGCRQGSDLVDAINDAMKQLYDDGTMMEIAEKYNLQDMIIAQ